MTFSVIYFILTKLCEIPFLMAIRNTDRKICANLCQCATSTPLAQRAVQKLAAGMLPCHAVPMAHWHATWQRHGNPWSSYQRVSTTIYCRIEVVVTTIHQHFSSKYLSLKVILVTWEYRELFNRTAY